MRRLDDQANIELSEVRELREMSELSELSEPMKYTGVFTGR